MKRRLFLVLILLVAKSYAQKDFVEGYIIVSTGDTLHGKINDGINEDCSTNRQKIRFIDESGKQQKYKATKAKEYCKKGFPVYKTIITNRGNKKFAEILESGEVILFRYYKVSGGGGTFYNYGGGNANYVSRPKVTYIEYYVQKRGNEKPQMMVPMRTFRSAMSKFFSDDQDIQKRIEDKTLLLEHLQDIVKEYNDRKAKK